MSSGLLARRRLALRGAILFWVIAGVAAGASAADRPVADTAQRADWGAVRVLVDQGADVTARQGDGATALHWAAYWDEVDVAGLLLDAGADVNAANDLGVTPLWAAAENGRAPMVRRLLRGGGATRTCRCCRARRR